MGLRLWFLLVLLAFAFGHFERARAMEPIANKILGNSNVFGLPGGKLPACSLPLEPSAPLVPYAEVIVDLKRELRHWDLRHYEFQAVMGCAKGFRDRRFLVLRGKDPIASDQARGQHQDFKDALHKKIEGVEGRLEEVRRARLALPPMGESCGEQLFDLDGLIGKPIAEITSANLLLNNALETVFYQAPQYIGREAPKVSEKEGQKKSLYHRMQQIYGTRRDTEEKCHSQYKKSLATLLEATRNLAGKLKKVDSGYLNPMAVELRNMQKQINCAKERCQTAGQ